MRRHHHARAGGDSRPERHHLAAQHLLPGLVAYGIAEVGIGRCVPVPREMLEAAVHALRLQRLEVGSYHLPCLRRAVGEGPGAYYNVAGIGIDIGHRGKVYVYPKAVEVFADGPCRFLDGALSL